MAFPHKPNHLCIHPPEYITELHSRQPSNCGACETPIIGKTKNCSACNSFLHPFCSASEETMASKIHPEHRLKRLNQPLMRRCTVCTEEIKGVSYTCFEGCDFDVHPQCSRLPCSVPHELVDLVIGLKPTETARHEFALQLGGKTLHVANCRVCGDRCGKWAYRCHVCSVNVHFWCLLSCKDEPERLTTTTARGLEHHFDPPRHGHGEGQPHFYGVRLPHQPHFYGVPLPHQPHFYGVPLPHQPHFYGVPLPHQPHFYGVPLPHHYQPHGNQWAFNQFQNQNNNWGGGEGYLYNQGAGINGGGGWVGYNSNQGGGTVASGSGSGSDSSSSGVGRIMERIGKSLAVSLICDLILNMFGC